MTDKAIFQWCDQSNKRTSDAESAAFEVKYLVASSGSEVQNLKSSINRIKRLLRMVESGYHPSIFSVQQAVSYFMTLNIVDSELDYF